MSGCYEQHNEKFGSVKRGGPPSLHERLFEPNKNICHMTFLKLIHKRREFHLNVLYIHAAADEEGNLKRIMLLPFCLHRITVPHLWRKIILLLCDIYPIYYL